MVWCAFADKASRVSAAAITPLHQQTLFCSSSLAAVNVKNKHYVM